MRGRTTVRAKDTLVGVSIGVFVAVMLPAGCMAAEPGAVELSVPRVAIYPGVLITDAMIDHRAFSRDVVRGGELYALPGAAIGRTARRTLLPNQPIPREAIRGTPVILSGQATRLVYQVGGLRVTADGLALNSAAVGEVVQVRNLISGTTVTGIAAADRSVSVSDE